MENALHYSGLILLILGGAVAAFGAFFICSAILFKAQYEMGKRTSLIAAQQNGWNTPDDIPEEKTIAAVFHDWQRPKVCRRMDDYLHCEGGMSHPVEKCVGWVPLPHYYTPMPNKPPAKG